MAKKVTTGSNSYEDSAQGAKRWGVSSNYNGTNAPIGANSKGRRGAERPSSKTYSLADAEADRPDVNDILKSHR